MFEGREWFCQPPAAKALLEELRQTSPVELPAAYYALLSYSDGGEGPLSATPYNLCLDPVAQVIEALRVAKFGQPELDGFVVFGGNGGGEYLAFDVRTNAPWPIVMIDMTAGAGSVQRVAPDFEAFLSFVGRESDAH